MGHDDGALRVWIEFARSEESGVGRPVWFSSRWFYRLSHLPATPLSDSGKGLQLETNRASNQDICTIPVVRMALPPGELREENVRRPALRQYNRLSLVFPARPIVITQIELSTSIPRGAHPNFEALPRKMALPQKSQTL